MAAINGTNLAAPIVPFTTEDSYATHVAQYGKGGWHEVATVSERDAIIEGRREAGMAVYVTEENKLYILNDDLTTWTLFEAGNSNVNDVKVDGTSVVTNRVANIDLTGKQDVLTPGDNITISDDDNISADVPLKGVKVNNVDLTIDSNKKVNLPIADMTNLGLVKVESSSSDRGVQISSGVLQTVPSNNSQIDAGNSTYTVITPTNLNYAVKKGIINNNIILTESEKTAAKTWIGANATYNATDEEIIFG